MSTHSIMQDELQLNPTIPLSSRTFIRPQASTTEIVDFFCNKSYPQFWLWSIEVLVLRVCWVEGFWNKTRKQKWAEISGTTSGWWSELVRQPRDFSFTSLVQNDQRYFFIQILPRCESFQPPFHWIYTFSNVWIFISNHAEKHFSKRILSKI